MPQFSHVPLTERPTGDLVGGLVWCSGLAVVVFLWLGSWVLAAGFSLAGLLLLAVWLFLLGISITGAVRIARELHRRRGP